VGVERGGGIKLAEDIRDYVNGKQIFQLNAGLSLIANKNNLTPQAQVSQKSISSSRRQQLNVAHKIPHRIALKSIVNCNIKCIFPPRPRFLPSCFTKENRH
jgi:hypothetical protein